MGACCIDCYFQYKAIKQSLIRPGYPTQKTKRIKQPEISKE